MRVAMVGLGKLGLPVSCAFVLRGHGVWGYEIDAVKRERYRRGKAGLYEPNVDDVLTRCLDSGLCITDTLEETVRPVEIVFIAVPTPSLTDGQFDTRYVERVLSSIVETVRGLSGYRVIAVISTVLPTVHRRVFVPLLGELLPTRLGLVYNAQFIALGLVIEDILNPEYVLVGEYDERSGDVLEKFYRQISEAPVFRMTIENAELVKICHNAFLGQKIVLGNTIMELCDKIPNADCDVVVETMCRDTRRIMSKRYLRGGLAAGGPCLQRDGRALSALAHELDLSFDPFAFTRRASRQQTEYIAQIVQQAHWVTGLPVAIMGLTFKPDTDQIEDSPSLLLMECLRDRGVDVCVCDPTLSELPLPRRPSVYVVATCWPEFQDYRYVPGSTIVDPWRFLKETPPGCNLRKVGIGED